MLKKHSSFRTEFAAANADPESKKKQTRHPRKSGGWIPAFAGMTVLFMLTACQPIPTPKTITVNGHEFQIEIADSPAEREQGLMFREDLCDSCGMLFVFENPQPVSFWMKNTLLPLDILYFDANKKLKQIYADTRPCQPESVEGCPNYPSESNNIKFTLELPAGKAAQIGAKIGGEFNMRN